MGAGAAVGGRRALVEAPDRGVLALCKRALEDPLLAPAREHPLLQLGEGLFGIDGFESGHEAQDSMNKVQLHPPGNALRKRRQTY